MRTDPYAGLDEVFDRLAGVKSRAPYLLRVTPDQLERLVEGLLALDDPEDRALGRQLADAAREGHTIDLTGDDEPVGEDDDSAIRASHADTAHDHNRSRP